MFCIYCSGELPSDASFCSHCGRRLDRVMRMPTITCQHCRAVSPNDATFCWQCGKRLAEDTLPPVADLLPGLAVGGPAGTGPAVPMVQGTPKVGGLPMTQGTPSLFKPPPAGPGSSQEAASPAGQSFSKNTAPSLEPRVSQGTAPSSVQGPAAEAGYGLAPTLGSPRVKPSQPQPTRGPKPKW